MADLLSVSAATEKLLQFFSPLDVVGVDISKALGEVLAEEIIAIADFPHFTNSSMDGFAVRASDVANCSAENPVILDVVADIPAGSSREVTINSGQSARIMTGALLPFGSDAVVPVENTDFFRMQLGEDAPIKVKIFRSAVVGENIRPRGQDFHSGETVLYPGVKLSPKEIGFLGMLGVSRVPVYRRPLVAVFSTGDELMPVGQPLAQGKIYDSNTYMVTALVSQAGGEALNLGIIPDDMTGIRATLDHAAERKVDLIISSAGVSVGAFDYLRKVVESHGELAFWRVNMRPGKPLAFGRYRGIPYFGLPGNPVSAFVGFQVFIRQAIEKMIGSQHSLRTDQSVILLEPIESDGRESYLRARVFKQDGELVARLSGHQGSGNLRALVQANALIVVPSGVKSLPSGSRVVAWCLDT